MLSFSPLILHEIQQPSDKEIKLIINHELIILHHKTELCVNTTGTLPCCYLKLLYDVMFYTVFGTSAIIASI